MFAANTYVIRHVAGAERLAELDSQRPLTGPALVGEIEGRPAAAISLADGPSAPAPSQHPPPLARRRRWGAHALSEHERTPSLSERLRERLPDGRRVAPG